jgi:hypothetical protein
MDRQERAAEARRRAAEAARRARQLREVLARLQAGGIPSRADAAEARRDLAESHSRAQRARELAALAHEDAVGRHLIEAVFAEVAGDERAARLHRHFATVCQALAEEEFPEATGCR